MKTLVNLSDGGYKIKEVTVDDGSYRYLILGQDQIKDIEVHPAMGEGDEWFIRVKYENESFKDFFHIVDIGWIKSNDQSF